MNQRRVLPLGVVLVLALAILLNYVDRSNLSLAVPANAYAGSYSSTWTYSLASAP